jgi:hypothetical protein
MDFFLGFQIKDMALKAAGAYKPCAGFSSPASRRHHRYHHAYRRAGSFAASTPMLRRGGSMSSGDATPSVSARTDFLGGDGEGAEEEETAAGGGDEDEEQEWVAQVEPGVLISFLSLPQGGNSLKRIRFR